MKKFMLGLLIMAGLLATVVAVPVAVDVARGPAATQAEAATCTFPSVCGRIHERMGPDTSLIVTEDWNCGSFCRVHTLVNGQSSETFWKDVEGFYISPGVRIKLYRYLSTVGWTFWGYFTGAPGSGSWIKVDDLNFPGWWEVNLP